MLVGKDYTLRGEIARIFAKLSLALGNDGHLLEGRNPLAQGRMGAEERPEAPAAKQRLDNAKRGRRGRDGTRWNAVIVCSQLLERANQAIRIPYHSGASFISRVFPLAGERQLKQKSPHWGKEE